ncbi:hypothetical protein L208DRAFT_1385076 [Tricholoma matsutake]|nr:hypothetical protein L208DRAFT_1385076 [Tricholoma matsutake 945]
MELGVQVKPPEEAKIATKYKPDKYSSSSSKESDLQPRTPPPIQGDQVHATPSKIRTRQIQYIRVWLLPNSIPRHRYRPQSVVCAPVEFS